MENVREVKKESGSGGKGAVQLQEVIQVKKRDNSFLFPFHIFPIRGYPRPCPIGLTSFAIMPTVLSLNLPTPLLILSLGSLLRRKRGKGWGPKPKTVCSEEDCEDCLQSTTAGFLHTDPVVGNSRRWYLYYKGDELCICIWCILLDDKYCNSGSSNIRCC